LEPPPPGRSGERSGSALLAASFSYDRVTGLPSSSDILVSAAGLARVQETQVVCLQLDGLVEVGQVYGERVADLLFRQIVRRLGSLLGPHDLMGRHADSSLFIFTSRVSAELQDLVEAIHQQVRAVAILTSGRLLPETHVGVAIVPQTAEEHDALAAIEAAIGAAEQAALQPEALQRPLAPSGMAEAVPSPKEPIKSVVGPREVPPTRDSGQLQPLSPGIKIATTVALGESSIVIRRFGIAMEGAAARAMITLALRSREVEAEASGKNTPPDRLALVGEVTAMAVTKLLPQGHTVSVVSIDEVSERYIRLVRAVIKIGDPAGSKQLSATMSVRWTTYSTAAQAVLQAVEPHVREILRIESTSTQ